MSEQGGAPANANPTGDPSTSAAAAAGAASAAPAPDAKQGKRFFVKCVSECYRGMDPGNGNYLNLAEGDIAEVTEKKYDQLFADFPTEFEPSSEADMKKALATKEKRAKEQNEKRAKKEAARAAAAAKAAKEDDDDLE